MEDNVVQCRCSAVIQQIMCGAAFQQQPHLKRSLTALAEALQGNAMLLYRLCRAKGEKISADQTEDAAYCVLASVASLQPSLWAQLTEWSKLLRPKQPILTFVPPVPLTVKVKEVVHFIARTAHLLSNFTAALPNAALLKSSEDSVVEQGVQRKRGRDEKVRQQENTLETKLVLQMAFAYFRLTLPNVKKLQAIVVTHESEGDGENLAAQFEGTQSIRGYPFSYHQLAGYEGRAGDAVRLRSSTALNVVKGYEEDDEQYDAASIALPLAYPAPLSSFSSLDKKSNAKALATFTSSVSLPVLADTIDATRSALYYIRLQRCLRDPLLFSPIDCGGNGNSISTCGVASSGGVQLSSMSFSSPLRGEAALSLFSPSHFLHPSRARLQSLLPLPLQMVTAEYLWVRLLVVGIWLLCASSLSEFVIDDRMLYYYRRVVKAASKSDVVCLVCDGLVRERPALSISALGHSTWHAFGETVGKGEHLSWEEIKLKSRQGATTNEGIQSSNTLSYEVLRGLSWQLHQKARKLAGKGTAGQWDTTGASVSSPGAKGQTDGEGSCNGGTIPTLPSLRELAEGVRGSYPIGACCAALIGDEKSEAAIRRILSPEREVSQNDDLSPSRCSACVVINTDANQGIASSSEVDELLSMVPHVPGIRETDAVLECAGCFLLFHQSCVCPTQRDVAGGCFLCHNCRLRRSGQLRLDQRAT